MLWIRYFRDEKNQIQKSIPEYVSLYKESPGMSTETRNSREIGYLLVNPNSRQRPAPKTPKLPNYPRAGQKRPSKVISSLKMITLNFFDSIFHLKNNLAILFLKIDMSLIY